ncbi:MAG: SPFH domain-containing protein [Thermoplasmatota archaeon]
MSASGSVGVFALVVGAFVAFTLIIILIYASRYKRVPPGKALVVYGKGIRPPGYIIITAGGMFILPVVQGHNFIPLDKWNCEIPVEGLASNSDPQKRIDMKLYCQFGIGDDEKNMQKAVKNFLRKSDSEVHDEIEEMIKAHASAVSRDLFRKYPLPQLADDWTATGEMVRKRVEAKVSFMGVTVPTTMVKELRVLDVA